MSLNLNEKTVIELRKLAKELRVPLSAGISKQGIIDKLTPVVEARSQAEAAAAQAAPAPEAPVGEPAAAEAPAPAEAPAQPAPRTPAAAPRFNTKPAYQAPAYGARPGMPRVSANMESQRTATTRPVGYTPRFGPAAAVPQPDHPAGDEDRIRTSYPVDRRATYEQRQPAYEQRQPAYEQRQPAYEQRQPAYEQRQPAYEQRQPAYEQRQPAYEQRQPAYEQRQPAYEQRQPAYEQRQPAYEQRQPAYEQRQPAYEQRQPAYSQRQGSYPQRSAAPAPQQNLEMLSPSECLEASGVLDMHPDGYGFLRGEGLLASPRDIYVSAAQVRRFNLRPGDLVSGRVRPLRDGDKYSAMLYVTEVNETPADEMGKRASIEQLTPIYPTRRISLNAVDGRQHADLRLLDLLTPIGFGQRALLQCPPEMARKRLLAHLANAIARNHPEATTSVLLFNENPEDVTELRDKVECPVLATTFDMPPENHLRLADMAMERALRQVEDNQDVVLLVDSLTTLCRVWTTAAIQQGRQVPGTVSPASLQKAKRLFGAARCTRESGSLTVIAVMNVETGSKVDDAVVNEFRGTANMELAFSAALARSGVYPPVDLLRSGTRRSEGIITPAHANALVRLKELLGSLAPDAAVRELLGMLEKTSGNEDLLTRIVQWADALKG